MREYTFTIQWELKSQVYCKCGTPLGKMHSLMMRELVVHSLTCPVFEEPIEVQSELQIG